MQLRLIVVLLATLALMQACGFHLRGKVDLPERLTSFHVDGKDPDLVAELQDALEFSGAEIVDGDAGATAVLELTDIAFLREVRSVDERGLATSYNLRYRVRFKIEENNGEELLKETTITLSRFLNFDSSQILQAEEEQEFLREDMQRDMVQRIMQRLATIASVQPPRKVIAA
ncbi:MAG: LPS assembly lipoprotein LptE [Gammaproteobacteria bacterium]|nr:LPS assembly lipoprotein LptE [Gammaproteobacteria bacterium]